jgi:L-ascorbate metabolism protein UlaG (beta-lactamase superfamily)
MNNKKDMMRKVNKFYWLMLIVTLCGFSNQKKEFKVTFLANCGFLYEKDNSKVLIDPFGTEYGNFFYLPSEETKMNLVNGNIPFNKIDLLLITHIHGDHFNVKLTESFLLKNSKAKMICPLQVYKQMKDSCGSFAKIESQIISPNLTMNESKNIKINNISVTVIRMQHGTDRSLEGVSYSDYTEYEKTENFGYVIHFTRKNVFHQGDGCLRINKKALQHIDCSIDIAHLSYFDWDSISFNMLKKDLKAKKVVFMHGTKPAKELVSEQFKAIKPQIVFFNQELESKTFD